MMLRRTAVCFRWRGGNRIQNSEFRMQNVLADFLPGVGVQVGEHKDGGAGIDAAVPDSSVSGQDAFFDGAVGKHDLVRLAGHRLVVGVDHLKLDPGFDGLRGTAGVLGGLTPDRPLFGIELESAPAENGLNTGR